MKYGSEQSGDGTGANGDGPGSAGGSEGDPGPPNPSFSLPGWSCNLDLSQIAWRETRYEGVSWFPLHFVDRPRGEGGSDESASGEPQDRDATVLIRMDPGCSYPTHRHIGVEEVLVLAGGYRDELGLHSAGDFMRYPAGSTHSPVATGDPARPTDSTNPACLLFASARDGVETLA